MSLEEECSVLIGPITASKFGEELGRLLFKEGINIQIYPFYSEGEDDQKLYNIFYCYSTFAN